MRSVEGEKEAKWQVERGGGRRGGGRRGGVGLAAVPD